jgi:Holliday junction DNA helicase RuvB
MNFQKLVGILTKSRDDYMFEDIVGYDHIKRLFRMALESESTTHILLTGPPASAKTMFLTSLLRSLKNAYFIDGGNTTKAGVIDYLFENRPRYLLIDEADKLAPKHQTFLLNLMETGIVGETKYGKTRETKMNISVFATSNSTRNLSAALLSRFFVVELEPYSYGQFYEITLRILNNQPKIAPKVADSVWNTTKNIRDCVRIGKLARSEEDVDFLINMLHSNGMSGIDTSETGI